MKDKIRGTLHVLHCARELWLTRNSSLSSLHPHPLPPLILLQQLRFPSLYELSGYFERLGLGQDEAAELHHRYYTEYGLAIRGLVRHHKVDPLDYDKHCDAAYVSLISYLCALYKRTGANENSL